MPTAAPKSLSIFRSWSLRVELGDPSYRGFSERKGLVGSVLRQSFGGMGAWGQVWRSSLQHMSDMTS